MEELKNCPFRHRKEKSFQTRYDAAGKKIGEILVEELVNCECIQQKCAFFDKELNNCSLSILHKRLQELPKEVKKELDSSLFEKAEMLSVVFSTNIQQLQNVFNSYKESFIKMGEKTHSLLEKIINNIHIREELSYKKPEKEPPIE